MNILVIGNGFDIEHGLKTEYKDFLNAIGHTYYILSLKKPERDIKWDECKECKKCNIPQALIDSLGLWVKNKRNDSYTLNNFLKPWGNFWFQFFVDKPTGKWIDFERDIKEVCLFVENMMCKKDNIKTIDDGIDLVEDFSIYKKYIKEDTKIETYKQLIELLDRDLYDLVKSLDIYISHFIDKEECDVVSRDIVSLKIDKVISFNYSNTYQRLYAYYKDVKYDFVHGKAGMWVSKAFTNLVLGYDEDENNINEKLVTVFAPFKKYYQRVLKETGNQYSKWVKEIHADFAKEENQDEPKKIHNVYFFGHSIDITDKDIIRAIILNKNVKTTIYYHSNKAKMDIVKNLIPVLDYNNFLEYTKGGNIKFVHQYKPVSINNSVRYRSLKAVKNLYDLPYISKDEYEKLDDWFNNISGKNFRDELIYFYLAIDALQKWNVENDRIEYLLKLCENNQGNPCSYDDFLEEYTLFCGAESKFNNGLLGDIIKINFENRSNRIEEKYERFLRNIGINGQTYYHYKFEKGYLNLTSKRLYRVKTNFLQRFDKSIACTCLKDEEKPLSQSEIFKGMVDFLLLIKEDLVKELFASVIGDEKQSKFNKDKMQILLEQYTCAWKAKEDAINGQSEFDNLFKDLRDNPT